MSKFNPHGFIFRLTREPDIAKELDVYLPFFEEVVRPLLLGFAKELLAEDCSDRLKEKYADLLHAVSCTLWGCTGKCEECEVGKVLDEITPENLENFAFLDAYVNTACPRLNIDNEDVFKKPIIGIGEIDYVLHGEIEKYDFRKALQIL